MNEKLKYAERTENEEQSLDTLQVEGTESEDKKRQSAVQQEKAQNKQVVSSSFDYNVASKRKQVSIAVAAMHKNASWPSFFSAHQTFSVKYSSFFNKCL
ncbi:hypothetical protein [Wolbachia pipientis]|uniref:hypothetical protein n=1 Tax=Wolbachia pipientis TaxID=955 RepID=UPI0025A3F421|nr:hypothetical protein [Wolbachia pipientis]MDM8335517.1 hypothetical protein [Wolbachia pipientis]